MKIAGPTLTKKKITVQIMDEINQQISGFLRVQVITSLLVAVATAVGAVVVRRGQLHDLGTAGRDLQLDSRTSARSSSPAASRSSRSCSSTIWCATAYVSGTALAITSLEGWLLTPLLMSRAAQMNPVAIFVGLLFWSWVWGVWGTILAVPMLMAIKAVCDRVEDLQPIGELLGE